MNYIEELEPQGETLSRGLGISIAVHLIIFGFVVIKAAFFTPESIDFSQAIRIDMVGLPDKLDPNKALPAETKENPKPAMPEKEKPAEAKPPEPVKPAPTPHQAVKPEVKPPKPAAKPEGINLEKNKAQQQSAIDKLKQMAAMEKLKAETAKPPPGTGKDKAGEQKIKGNMVSPGTALTGLNKLQHDQYGAALNNHIKQNWTLPEWFTNRDYKAQVRVKIDSNGNILERKIAKSSGNPDYDEAALKAIDRSAPFPAPPEKFVALVANDGILIGFPE